MIKTPGPTQDHVSFVVGHHRLPTAVFSGGGLPYGSVGRTALVQLDRTERRAHSQLRSARRRAHHLDDAALEVTHGSGSMRSAGPASEVTSGTIGDQGRSNDALTTADEDAFVTRLLAGLTAYPTHYAHRDRATALDRRRPDAGATGGRRHPRQADRRREWVVDLRDRTASAAEHLAGSVGIEIGQQFAIFATAQTGGRVTERSDR